MFSQLLGVIIKRLMDRQRVLDGLEFLSKNDRNQKTLYGFKTYGANKHRFILNRPLPIEEIERFEQRHSIKLPNDYVEFITKIGNGGAGPGNGLHPLEKWNHDLNSIGQDFLKTPFPHIENWNIKGDLGEKHENVENEYFNNRHVTGAIRVSDFGCGINYIMVVSGIKSGTIWVDDRCSDFGIYCSVAKETNTAFTFTNWYIDWLEKSIDALK